MWKRPGLTWMEDPGLIKLIAEVMGKNRIAKSGTVTEGTGFVTYPLLKT